MLSRCYKSANPPQRSLSRKFQKWGVIVTYQKTEDLQTFLSRRLKGQQRVPALLTSSPCIPLQDLGPESLQTLPVEPLHDLKGHLSHVMTEVQQHMPKDKELATITSTAVNAEHGRSCDWMKAVVVAAKHGEGKVGKLMTILANISQTLYASATKCTQKMILCLYLLMWKQFQLVGCHG